MSLRGSVVCFFLAALLVGFTLLPPSAAAQPAGAEPAEEGPPGAWLGDELGPVHELLRAGEWEQAARRAGELVKLAMGDERQSFELADALLMRAVADANLGRLREAEIGLWAAGDLGRAAFPALGRYGSGGRFLWDQRLLCSGPHRPEAKEGEPCTAADPLTDAAVTPPRPLGVEPLDRAALETGGLDVGDEHLLVRLVLDETGRPTEASVLAAADGRVVPALLTAVADWRFEPAWRDGEPVAALYESSVPLAAAVRVAEKDGTASVEAWRRRLAAAEASIAAGEHATALPAVAALQDEMQRLLVRGGSDLLAEASMLRALAEAALAEGHQGRTAAAVWHWQVAQNLAPQLRYRELGRWGEGGAVLAAHLLSPVTLGDKASTWDDAPRVVARTDPRAGAAGSGLVEIDVAIDAEGRPRRPVWSAGASPARVSAALEALLLWRFDPAPGERRRRVVVQVTDTAESIRLTNGLIGLIGLAARWMDEDPVTASCLWSSAQSFEPRLSVIDPSILAGPEEIQRFVLDHLLAPAAYRDWSPFLLPAIRQVDGEVEPPVKVSTPHPQYTAEARAERVEGRVIVQSIIDAEGRIQRLRVLRGLPHGLSEATVATICRWRFKPARLAGEKVGVYYNLTVNFTLR